MKFPVASHGEFNPRKRLKRFKNKHQNITLWGEENITLWGEALKATVNYYSFNSETSTDDVISTERRLLLVKPTLIKF